MAVPSGAAMPPTAAMPPATAAVPPTAAAAPMLSEGRSRDAKEEPNAQCRQKNGTMFHFNLPPVVRWPAHERIWSYIVAKSRQSCANLLLNAPVPRYNTW
jgi:hypothetical protein